MAATAALERDYKVMASNVREKVWRDLYIRGHSPASAAAEAEIHAHKSVPMGERQTEASMTDRPVRRRGAFLFLVRRYIANPSPRRHYTPKFAPERQRLHLVSFPVQPPANVNNGLPPDNRKLHLWIPWPRRCHLIDCDMDRAPPAALHAVVQ
jgi:hypothetical protein